METAIYGTGHAGLEALACGDEFAARTRRRLMRGSPLRWALAALVLAPLGAGAAVEDRTWCVTAGPHFELVSDLRKRKARALAASLDRFRVAASALLPGPPAAGHAGVNGRPGLRLLAFKRASDFVALFEFPRIAGFSQPSLDQSLLVFGPSADGYRDTIAFHEYTHHLLHTRVALNLPVWYEEGFASYAATLDVADGVVTAGRGPHGLLRHLLAKPGTGLEEVIGERYRLDWQRHDLSNIYVLSWGVVRFLLHAPRPNGERFAADVGGLLEAIDRGTPSTVALQESLGVDVAGLRDLMRDYYGRLGDGPPPVFRFPLPPQPPTEFSYECLSEHDRRLVLADAVARHRPAQAATLFRAVLADEPRHAAALVGLSRVQADEAEALATAEAAVAAAPGDAAAQVRLAEARIANCQADAGDACDDAWAAAAAACRRALALDSGRADAVYCLGLAFLRGDKLAEALLHLREALWRAPWSLRVHYHLGLAYWRLGAAREARRHLRKTAYWHPDAVWRQRAFDALDKLNAATAPPATTPPEARG